MSPPEIRTLVFIDKGTEIQGEKQVQKKWELEVSFASGAITGVSSRACEV